MNLATLSPRREPVQAGFPPRPACAGSEQQGRFFMRVLCSWCRCDLGTKPCDEAQNGTTSHGVCPACYVKEMMPELCERISNASVDELILLLLLPLMTALDEIEAKGVRELCRRRQQELAYLQNVPVNDLG